MLNFPPHRQTYSFDNAEIDYIIDFIPADESQLLFNLLESHINWKQDTYNFYGKQSLSPRLTAWYGEENAVYTYSGIKNKPNAWTPTLLNLKRKAEYACCTKFNSVLLNLYRDGSDSIGWHSDNEPELGENPVIASISLGDTRKFYLRHKITKITECLSLRNGSLLSMYGNTQKFWQHCIKKEKNVGKRINLTFRQIYR
jgi:alkylated DNA repair dioxygenase AlkB